MKKQVVRTAFIVHEFIVPNGTRTVEKSNPVLVHPDVIFRFFCSLFTMFCVSVSLKLIFVVLAEFDFNFYSRFVTIKER